MANKDVKILYCKDANNNPVFYTNTEKDKKYYCIDCGEELIIKDGNVKQKHLSHKANSSCLSTGESYIHKYYKEHLFLPGITIYTKEGIATIEKVLTEEWLNNRYDIAKTWDKKIRPDVILETDKGDVIVELCKTNAKKWEDLIYYYDQLEHDVCEIFELYINSINSFTWITYNEIKSEIKRQRKEKEQKELLSKKKLEVVLDAIKNRESGKSFFYFDRNIKPCAFDGFVQIVGATKVASTFKIVYLRIKYKSEEDKNNIINSFYNDDHKYLSKAWIEYQYIDPNQHTAPYYRYNNTLPCPRFKADNVLFCTKYGSFKKCTVKSLNDEVEKYYYNSSDHVFDVLLKITPLSESNNTKKDSIYKKYIDIAQKEGIIKSSNHNG